MAESKGRKIDMHKPIIGITTLCENRIKRSYQCISYHYIRSIELSGGIPFPLPLSQQGLETYLEVIDGLVLSGGEDIAPSNYKETPLPELGEVCAVRDGFEIKLFLKAIEKKMPVLGICRGHQLMNVALGGNLYQDIHAVQGSSFNHLAVDQPVDTLSHTVTLETTSKLYEILGQKEMQVNTLHHQAIKELGKDLKVAATSFDGLIEGIEYTGGSFALGVQWHPEDLAIKHMDFIKLFDELVKEAGQYKGLYKQGFHSKGE